MQRPAQPSARPRGRPSDEITHAGAEVWVESGANVGYEALAHVDAVNRLVNDRYNPGGRAHWYGYGTVAMPCGYARPGKLNEEVLP